MRNIKILLLISTIVFSGDLGPLHQYMPVIAAASTILFGVTTYMMFQQVNLHPRMRAFAIFTALIFVAVAVITIVLLTTGNRGFYDFYSVVLLLPVYLNTILAFVLLREKK